MTDPHIWMEKAGLVALIPVWISVLAILVIGRCGAAPSSATIARSGKSQFGFAMQLIGYAIVFAVPRPRFTAIVPMPAVAEGALLLAATVIGFASIWLCYSAARTLGKQWSLVARVVRGHELIAQGPYALVRHPIYLAMFGLLVQSGIAVSMLPALLPAAVAFLLGTQVRITEEEKILREEFGAQYDAYAQRVPALIPRLGK